MLNTEAAYAERTERGWESKTIWVTIIQWTFHSFPLKKCPLSSQGCPQGQGQGRFRRWGFRCQPQPGKCGCQSPFVPAGPWRFQSQCWLCLLVHQSIFQPARSGLRSMTVSPSQGIWFALGSRSWDGTLTTVAFALWAPTWKLPRIGYCLNIPEGLRAVLSGGLHGSAIQCLKAPTQRKDEISNWFCLLAFI